MSDKDRIAALESADGPARPDHPAAVAWPWTTRKAVPFHHLHPLTGRPIVPRRRQGDVEREQNIPTEEASA